MVERIATRLHGEREELGTNMEEFSTGLFQWSLNEPQLVDSIRGMGSCVENCTHALKTLVRGSLHLHEPRPYM